MLDLFLTFFKIGMFTIGGGYVMIPLVKDYCIEKKKWINNEEFLDVLSIAESTPGPIAINMATYVGYKKKGFLGGIISTLGVVLPSFIIIYLIAFVFDDLLNIELIKNAFIGIRIGVVIVIIETAINMLKTELKTSKDKKVVLIEFAFFTLLLIISSIYNLNINTIVVIIIAIVIAIIMMLVKKL